MAIKKIFKSTLSHVNFVTKKGKTLVFKDSKYVTGDASEVLELEDEIKSGHPHIYIDDAEKEIDTTLEDTLKKELAATTLRVMEQHAASKKAEQTGKQTQAGQTNQMGASEAIKLSVATPAPAPAPAAMSAATLLGVTSTAGLAGLGVASNSK